MYKNWLSTAILASTSLQFLPLHNQQVSHRQQQWMFAVGQRFVSYTCLINTDWPVIRQEVEVGQPGRKQRRGNENSGKREVSVCSRDPAAEERRCDCLA